jgi:hypothetical protein
MRFWQIGGRRLQTTNTNPEKPLRFKYEQIQKTKYEG